MAGDHAVTVTKTSVPEEYMRTFLTETVVNSAVLTFLRNNYPLLKPEMYSHQEGGSSFTMDDDGVRISIYNGLIQVNTAIHYDVKSIDQFTEDTQNVLAKAADQLFQQQVWQALSSLFGQVSSQVVEVDNAGTSEQAIVFTVGVQAGEMRQTRIFVLPRGEMQVSVDEGNFEQARAATLTLLTRLQAQGIPVELVGEKDADPAT